MRHIDNILDSIGEAVETIKQPKRGTKVPKNYKNLEVKSKDTQPKGLFQTKSIYTPDKSLDSLLGDLTWYQRYNVETVVFNFECYVKDDKERIDLDDTMDWDSFAYGYALGRGLTFEECDRTVEVLKHKKYI